MLMTLINYFSREDAKKKDLKGSMFFGSMFFGEKAAPD